MGGCDSKPRPRRGGSGRTPSRYKRSVGQGSTIRGSKISKKESKEKKSAAPKIKIAFSALGFEKMDAVPDCENY
jgi:hypothetical protein